MSVNDQFNLLMHFCYLGYTRSQEVDLTKFDFSEELCSRCGKCCQDKALVDGKKVKYLQTKCKHLVNNQCSIYSERKKLQPSCYIAKDALMVGLLPKDCAYVQKNWELIKDWYLFPEE